MIRIYTKSFYFILIFNTLLAAQVTGLLEDFNDGDISGWKADHERTFQLSSESGSLKINYTRTASSDIWDNFNFTPSVTVNLSNNKVISVRVKSSVSTQLTFKPIYEDNTNDWLQANLLGDNSWKTVTFKVVTANLKMTKMYLYLDGGSTTIKTGVVLFDEIRFGDSVLVSSLDWVQLDKAIEVTETLLQNSIEGTWEGQFPAGSKNILQSVLNYSKGLKTNSSTKQSEVDKAVIDLYDACSTFESSVIASEINLSDKKATKQTRYLYMNLDLLQKRSLLFGMHDATGYGVGWSGDNDRSDVKDVCGDYPAVFSEDLSGVDVEENSDLANKYYRLSSAYNRGTVITMCWHQLDPDNRSFYAADINNERIVEKIIPGGSHHNEYKLKLDRIGRFFKSLRGQNGESVPVIIRPYHEHLGNWFWWGPAHCTTQEFNTLWQFTVSYLRDSLNVHNLIWAISPPADLIKDEGEYFRVYPGDDFVDLFGGDFYFGDVVDEDDRNLFLESVQSIAKNSLAKNKVSALTEVGQEGLDAQDWFTRILLDPLKYDSVASKIVYAAVWRNANTSHHFAPYPGDPSVPDFIKFYNDSYTLFSADLPAMYSYPEPDVTPPVFLTASDTTLLFTSTKAKIEVETNERAYLKYSFSNEPYENMVNSFGSGEGTYNHSTFIDVVQGEGKTIYVKAADLYGNSTLDPLVINIVVDTMQAPVAWNDLLYPTKEWLSGVSPLGTSASSATILNSVITVYFRKVLNLDANPATMAILLRCYGGAAIYINGNEYKRVNLPVDSELYYDTEPTTGAQVNKSFTLDTTALKYFHPGENLIAVEVHSLPQSSVDGFNMQVFNQQGVLIPLGSEWTYYDKGSKPQDMKLSDITMVALNGDGVPADFKLYSNYPNPFNPSTVIRYDLPESDKVIVDVYNIVGQRVAILFNGYQSAGRYELRFDASTVNGGLSSGIYTIQVRTSEYKKAHKMMLVK